MYLQLAYVNYRNSYKLNFHSKTPNILHQEETLERTEDGLTKCCNYTLGNMLTRMENTEKSTLYLATAIHCNWFE